MSFTQESVHQLNLIMQFPDTSMEGLKIHHTAAPEVITAAQDLFDKGLTTQKDGGYLTDLGRSAAECVNSLNRLMAQDTKS